MSTAAAGEGMPPGTRDAVISCESGGQNIENPDSTASGYFQFINGTWRHFGGTEFAPRAIEATRAEQTVIADRAYLKNGLQDWAASRHCWQGKIGRHASGQEAPHHAVVAYNAHRRHHGTVGQIHVVQRGDTLSGIAAAHGLSLRTITRANREIIDDPNRIFPGQRIRI